MSSAHPGFENAAKSIADKQGIPMDHARAILAAGAHQASEKAVKGNKRLKHVPGVGKSMSAEDLEKFMSGLMDDTLGELKKMNGIDRAKASTKFQQMTSLDALCKMQNEMAGSDNSSDPEPGDSDDSQDANVNLKDQVMGSVSAAVKGDEDDKEDGDNAKETDKEDGDDALNNAKSNTASKSVKTGPLKKGFAQKLHQVVNTIQNSGVDNTSSAPSSTPAAAASSAAGMGAGPAGGDNNVPVPNSPPPKPKAHPAAAAAAMAFKKAVKGAAPSDGSGNSDNSNGPCTDKNCSNPNCETHNGKQDDRTPDKADNTGTPPNPNQAPQRPFK